MAGVLRRALDGLYVAAGALAALAVFGIFAVMMAQVLLRQFGVPLHGADDVVAYLCVAAAFLALAWTFTRGELIRVGLLVENIPPAARRWLELAVLSLAALLVGTILFHSWADAMFSREIEEVAQGTVPFPLWIPKLSIPLGVGILLVAVLDCWVQVLRGAKPPYQRAAEARAANHDFSG
ncbi:TRAP transporter small permease [Rubritepida flocculans]|uniref:TRAP transporter small permease n=1 Tax=Rubritepida flocculans TaxID=182403 RepID=UPI000403DE52|nr:TRAP transporter small permease [Rubritepida flocculans]